MAEATAAVPAPKEQIIPLRDVLNEANPQNFVWTLYEWPSNAFVQMCNGDPYVTNTFGNELRFFYVKKFPMGDWVLGKPIQ